MKPIRVLFVRNGRGITDVTGAESYLFALMSNLGATGVTSMLAAVRRPDQGEAPWLRELRRRQLPHAEVVVDSRFSIEDVIAVRRMAKDFGADVIHGVDHRADYVALATSRSLGCAAMASFFGWTNWSVDSTKGRLYAYLDRLAQRRLDAIIVDSGRSAELVDQGVHAAPVVVIPNGVDERRFDPDSAHYRSFKSAWFGREDVFVIGMVGRVHPNKGQLDFVRAVPALLARHPQCRFVIVGDAPRGFEEYLAQVDALIRDSAVADKVLMTNVESADIPAAIQSLDILASPSLLESFSYTLLESMCMRKPIVATDVGGNRVMMQDGVSGLLTPPGDVAALVTALERLLLDPDLRLRLGAAARARVLAEYGIGLMASRTAAVYREVIDWRGSREPRRPQLRERLERARNLRVGEAP